MFRIPIIPGVVLLLSTTPAVAAAYLEPEHSSFPSYDSALATVFKAAFANDVQVRAIVEPSLFLEFAVGVTKSVGAFHIFLLQPSTQVWQAVTSPDKQTDPAAIKVETCTMQLDAGIAERMVAAWKTALEHVRPSDRSDGLDGDSFQFSMTLDGHELSGQTWSPPPSSEAGTLANVAYAMRDACKAHDRRKLLKIGVLIDSFPRSE